METTFAPTPAATKRLSVSTTSARVRVKTTTGNERRCRVYNAGSVAVAIEFGGGAVAAVFPTAGTDDTAVGASMPIPAGGTETFTLGGASYVAAITASGTADLYVTPGEGF